MRNILTLLVVLFTFTYVSAQKKDRLKGSRTVTIAPREIAAFQNIEIADNIEVFLVRGSEPAIEIEADDNLHEAIITEILAGNLLVSTSKNIRSSKKLSLKITYTGEMNLLILKDDAVATGIDKMELTTLEVRTFDSAKFFGTIKGQNFTLVANDKSKIELNATAEKTKIDISKNATLKALISSISMTFDMYQKSNAEVEGDVIDLTLRLENNATFIGKKLTSTNCVLTSDSYTKCSIFADKTLVIDASGKTEIDVLGTPQIDIKNFADNAILAKK